MIINQFNKFYSIVRFLVDSKLLINMSFACLKKNGIGIDKFGIEVCYKKNLTLSTYSKQASTEKWLAPCGVMYDFKLATTLDPFFILDWYQNDECHDVRDLLTSQMMHYCQQLQQSIWNWNCFIWNWLIWCGIWNDQMEWNLNWQNGIDPMSASWLYICSWSC